MSSGDYAIRLAGVGKRYSLGSDPSSAGRQYKSLRESLQKLAARPRQVLRGALPQARASEFNAFWALKDVTFDVERGEVIAIIGANGAGKSTLLKILSRITTPTTGRIELRGRVGSLLEVGTGFHPELTGRENIFLNGAILGMTRAQVRARFDEIVAFSEIDRFLDTPVKQYSSGMYMRLAFAVAAHLEPDILIVDEVLAVGDSQFQQKCLGKMRDVAGLGRTVLFVTHNMPAVTTLCNRGCVLHGGELAFVGSASSAVSNYLERAHASEDSYIAVISPRHDVTSFAYVERVTLTCGGQVSSTLRSGDDLTISISYRSRVPIQPALGVVISSIDGSKLIHASVRNAGGLGDSVPRLDHGTLDMTLPSLTLTPGTYDLSLWFGDRAADHHHLPNCIRFRVGAQDTYRSGLAYTSEHSYVWWPIRVTANGAGSDVIADTGTQTA